MNADGCKHSENKIKPSVATMGEYSKQAQKKLIRFNETENGLRSKNFVKHDWLMVE